MYETIMDYLREQADKNDIRNLQFEQEIIKRIKKETDILIDTVLGCVYDDVNGIARVQAMMNGISTRFHIFNNNVATIYSNKFRTYYEMAYTQMDQLLETGKIMSANMLEKVKEMKIVHDEKTIDYIKNHALDMTYAYSSAKVEQIRASITELMLTGRGSKANVRNRIQKILDVNRSKAEEIAQTELSRAYNFGEMARMEEYNAANPDKKMRKYWHGFAESKITCGYCRGHIGEIYDWDDNTEELPAHPRCRCVWLPVLDGWDKPVSKEITRRANMLKMVYSPEQIYSRINSRLGISYGRYIDQDIATDYLGGDRSDNITNAIEDARSNAINDMKQAFGIDNDTSKTKYSNEFNEQMEFWKRVVSTAIVDNDNDLLNRSYDAIKGVMLLPWNADQMGKWDKLLSKLR